MRSAWCRHGVMLGSECVYCEGPAVWTAEDDARLAENNRLNREWIRARPEPDYEAQVEARLEGRPHPRGPEWGDDR